MPTGRSITSTCAARAALAGNPSDGYGGAVVALPITDLRAMSSATEADGFGVAASDRDLHRLLTATSEGFAEARGALPSITLGASTSIPRSVGLAGSSALIIAALRAMAEWTGHKWSIIELAELALSIERDRLGIEAGLQDRLVQAADRTVSMTFDPVGFRPIEASTDFPLFVAWLPGAARPSDTVHRSLRRRYDAGDPSVIAAMTALAQQADRAASAIDEGDVEALGGAMNASFDIRAAVIDIEAPQRQLIDVGRGHGAATNSAGSGGSVVGMVRAPERLEPVEAAYRAVGAEFLSLL